MRHRTANGLLGLTAGSEGNERTNAGTVSLAVGGAMQVPSNWIWLGRALCKLPLMSWLVLRFGAFPFNNR
jgi:hypothetical protein